MSLARIVASGGRHRVAAARAGHLGVARRGGPGLPAADAGRARRGLAGGAAAATAAGLWAIPRAGGEADPGWVVIDEVAGMWVAMLPLSRPAPLPVLAAFGLFRLFDIAKPGMIGRVDRVPGRLGVMGDDLLAGAAAAGVLWAGLRLVRA